MNKFQLNLLLLAAVCGGLIQAQNTFIGNASDVTVLENTLFYHGGDVQSTADGTNAIVNNFGNIQIDGNYINTGGDDGFVLKETTAGSSYGQLIIGEDASANSGNVKMEKTSLTDAQFNFAPFSFPFAAYNVNDLLSQVGNTSGAYNDVCPVGVVCGRRYYQTMFVWNNDAYRADPVPAAEIVNEDPTDFARFLSLNLFYRSPGLKAFFDGSLHNYIGAPGFAGTNVSITNSYPADLEAFDKNAYNERLDSYIDDVVRPANTFAGDNDFGEEIFQFGNPYPSNIDLSFIGIANEATLQDADGNNFVDDGNAFNAPTSQLLGVFKYVGIAYSTETGSSAVGATLVAEWDGSAWMGDAEALIIRPTEAFGITLAEGAGSNITFDFNDALKTFAGAPRAQDADPSIGPPEAFPDGSVDFGGAGNPSNDNTQVFGTNESVFQLGLLLNTPEGEYTGNRVYAVASPRIQAGSITKNEANYADFGSRTGVYLMQENADGTVLEDGVKYYINGIGLYDYVAKPIHIGFNANSTSELTQFKFTSELRQNFGLINGNYPTGDVWYFHDKDTDFLVTVDSEFEYDFTETQDRTDRFVLYWNQVPDENLNVTELPHGTSRTIVYSDGDIKKVRFSRDWKTADISIYDLSGRLISTDTDVATKTDYVLPLPRNAESYVIRLVSEKNVVEVRKVVND